MDTFVITNAEATFTCVIDSEPGSVVDITWRGPDSGLPSPVNTEQEGIVTSNLTINVTDGLNEGQLYNCSVEYRNCLNIVTSNSATFLIILLPTVVQPPVSSAFDSGDYLVLTCAAVTNYGTLSITWSGPVPDLQVMNTAVSENNHTSSLGITLFNFTFGGLYTCVATNEAGSDTSNATLFVRPMVLPTMILASEGDEIILRCEVQSFPASIIRWDKRNTSGVFEVVPDESEHNLTFRQIVFGNEGIYRCVAISEEFGNQVSTTSALITGKYPKIDLAIILTPRCEN
ncbi:hypothetical protein SPONN_2548 [uncultured Candidatus Thioglobus sp.]|nr:hypothetical protein SPONN_2548 [uncultured Candidatus Thioglobus sp.]